MKMTNVVLRTVAGFAAVAALAIGGVASAAETPQSETGGDRPLVDAGPSGQLRADVTGTWGEAPWSFDLSTGVLTVQGGTGDAPNLIDRDGRPWFGPDVTPESVKRIVLENPEGIKIAPNATYLFAKLPYLVEIEGIGSVDTSEVVTMYGMFELLSSLTSLDLSAWDTSQVTEMELMFHHSGVLESLDVSTWDTSNVTNMDRMFSYTYQLKSLDVSNWDTSKVTTMNTMFFSARSLEALDVSNWDTGNVTTTRWMFADTDSLQELDLSNWDTSNVETTVKMFMRAKSLSKLSLGPNSVLADDVELPAVIGDDAVTALWKLVDPSDPEAAPLWTGTSDELLARSRNPELAPGMYVRSQAVQVSFDTAEGEGTFEPISGAEGDTVVLPAEVPTRDGFSFTGWLYDGQILAAGADFVMPPGNITLVAQWEWNDTPPPPVHFTVEFDLNGAEGAVEAVEVAEGTVLALPAAPDREGFEFAGWLFEDAKYAAGAEFVVPASDVTMVAQWEAVPVPDPESATSASKPEQAGPPDSLAATGSGALPLVLTGLLALAVGASIVGIRRRA